MPTVDDGNNKVIQYATHETSDGRNRKPNRKPQFFKPNQKLNQSHILKTAHT